MLELTCKRVNGFSGGAFMYAKLYDEKEVYGIKSTGTDMVTAYNELITLTGLYSLERHSVSGIGFNGQKEPNQIREALIKGYVEMSNINLSICSECLQAEYEAEYTVERLVSGG